MALPDVACLGLHGKPLDAAIGQLLALYCPGGHQGNRQTHNNQQIHQRNGHYNGRGVVPVQYCAHLPIEEV
jgi:hypothetical protein